MSAQSFWMVGKDVSVHRVLHLPQAGAALQKKESAHLYFPTHKFQHFS